MGQSGGPASAAPSPFAQKPCDRASGPYERIGAGFGASDVLDSFAGSGGSAFRVCNWPGIQCMTRCAGLTHATLPVYCCEQYLWVTLSVVCLRTA